MLVGVAEARAELEDDEEDVVDDEGPTTAIAISSDTEEDRAYGTEHEHQSDAPGDIDVGLVEGLGQLADGQGDGEEVKSVPGLEVLVYMFGIELW